MKKLSSREIARLKKQLGDFDESFLTERKNNPTSQMLQKEATLLSLDWPERPMIARECKRKECGEAFLTSYKYVFYCSDACRRLELYKTYGIEAIDNNMVGKSGETLWGGRVPPYTIPEDVLAVMKFLVEKAETELGRPISAWQPKSSQTDVLGKGASSSRAPSRGLSDALLSQVASLSADLLPNLPEVLPID